MTPETSTELVPVKEACTRWGIKSAAFYERMKCLGLKAVKQGRKAFLNGEQLALLDKFDAHIKTTGTMDGFGAIVAAETSELEEASQAVEVEAEAAQPELDQDFEAIVRSAQEHAAGSLIAKYMLSAEIQNRPELLPDELKSQVSAAQKKAAPKSQSPQAVAAGMMSQFRQRMNLRSVSQNSDPDRPNGPATNAPQSPAATASA